MHIVKERRGSWVMIAQRRSGTHHLAHVVDPNPGTYVGPGSVATLCGKKGRVIHPLGALTTGHVVCERCERKA